MGVGGMRSCLVSRVSVLQGDSGDLPYNNMNILNATEPLINCKDREFSVMWFLPQLHTHTHMF